MSQKRHNILYAEFVKTDTGKLECLPKYFPKYKLFIEGLEPGQTIESFFEANVEDGSLAQLAKVHACIRQLGKELGYTFEDMKLEIKRISGLYLKKEVDGHMFMVVKSFAKCSKEDLAQVIEAINQVGETVGVQFK